MVLFYRAISFTELLIVWNQIKGPFGKCTTIGQWWRVLYSIIKYDLYVWHPNHLNNILQFFFHYFWISIFWQTTNLSYELFLDNHVLEAILTILLLCILSRWSECEVRLGSTMMMMLWLKLVSTFLNCGAEFVFTAFNIIYYHHVLDRSFLRVYMWFQRFTKSIILAFYSSAEEIIDRILKIIVHDSWLKQCCF